MSTATATRFKHAFDEQTHPNHRLWLPQRREYVEFRAGRFETDDDAVADEIIWCAEAGYTAAVYHSPEEQEAHAYNAEKKRAALARVAARRQLSEPTAVDAAEAEAVLAQVRQRMQAPPVAAVPRTVQQPQEQEKVWPDSELYPEEAQSVAKAAPQPRCQGARKDGQPCRLRPMLNSAFCRAHGLKRIADEEDRRA